MKTYEFVYFRLCIRKWQYRHLIISFSFTFVYGLQALVCIFKFSAISKSILVRAHTFQILNNNILKRILTCPHIRHSLLILLPVPTRKRTELVTGCPCGFWDNDILVIGSMHHKIAFPIGQFNAEQKTLYPWKVTNKTIGVLFHTMTCVCIYWIPIYSCSRYVIYNKQAQPLFCNKARYANI